MSLEPTGWHGCSGLSRSQSVRNLLYISKRLFQNLKHKVWTLRLIFCVSLARADLEAIIDVSNEIELCKELQIKLKDVKHGWAKMSALDISALLAAPKADPAPVDPPGTSTSSRPPWSAARSLLRALSSLASRMLFGTQRLAVRSEDPPVRLHDKF